MKLIHLKLKRECVLVEANTTEIADFERQEELEALRGGNILTPIGHFPSLTEQDFEGVVHKQEIEGYTYEGITYNEQFRNYNLSHEYWELKCDQLDTARESFLSALESEGYTFENPLGDEPMLNDECLWHVPELDSQVMAGFQYDLDKWKQAQEKVINLSNCYLFVKS